MKIKLMKTNKIAFLLLFFTSLIFIRDIMKIKHAKNNNKNAVSLLLLFRSFNFHNSYAYIFYMEYQKYFLVITLLY